MLIRSATMARFAHPLAELLGHQVQATGAWARSYNRADARIGARPPVAKIAAIQCPQIRQRAPRPPMAKVAAIQVSQVWHLAQQRPHVAKPAARQGQAVTRAAIVCLAPVGYMLEYRDERTACTWSAPGRFLRHPCGGRERQRISPWRYG